MVKRERGDGGERVLHRNMLSPCKFEMSLSLEEREKEVSHSNSGVNPMNSNWCMYPWVGGCLTGRPGPTQKDGEAVGNVDLEEAILQTSQEESPSCLNTLPVNCPESRRSTRAMRGLLPQRYRM